MSERFKKVEDKANLEQRESDLESSFFSIGVGAIGIGYKDISKPNWIGKPPKSPIENEVNAAVNAAVRMETDAKSNKDDYVVMIEDIMAISIDYKLNTLADVPKSLKKMKNYIKGISALNVLLTIRGLIDVGRKFLDGQYSIKNNLIDFNGDKSLNAREYDLSMRILRETIIYDIYANIVLPFAQMFPRIEIASYVFDPIIKAGHLEFGKDILNYMGKDEIYELYGFGRNEILVGSDTVVTSKQLLRGDVTGKIDDLRELIYGVKIDDIVEKPYYENTFDEVFMLLQSEGDFQENIRLMNEIFSSNPDDNAVDIANFIVFTRKNNRFFDNMWNRNLTSEIYRSYKDGEDIFNLGLNSSDEEIQLRNYFDYYYPSNTHKLVEGKEYRFKQVLEHNDKLKKLGYSQNSRQRTMMALFNNYDFNELGQVLEVDNTIELFEQAAISDKLRSTDSSEADKNGNVNILNLKPTITQSIFDSGLNFINELLIENNEKLKSTVSNSGNKNSVDTILNIKPNEVQNTFDSGLNFINELLIEDNKEPKSTDSNSDNKNNVDTTLNIKPNEVQNTFDLGLNHMDELLIEDNKEPKSTDLNSDNKNSVDTTLYIKPNEVHNTSDLGLKTINELIKEIRWIKSQLLSQNNLGLVKDIKEDTSLEPSKSKETVIVNEHLDNKQIITSKELEGNYTEIIKLIINGLKTAKLTQ